MKKWEVRITLAIQAKTREDAWRLSRELIVKHLRDLATVHSVGMYPLSNPDGWIAVNEPIKAQG